MRLREFPSALQNFSARPIEPHDVIPVLHDGQAVRNLAVAAAELDGDRTVGTFLRGDVIDVVDAVLVLREIPFRVVEADRPEGVNRHVLDLEAINRRAVVFRRWEIEIDRNRFRVATPRGRGCDQVADRVDLIFGAKSAFVIGNCRTKNQQRVAYFLLARSVPIRHLETAGTSGLHELGGVLQSPGRLEVLRVARIDQGAEHDHNVARTDLFFREDIIPRVEGGGRVLVILVDRQQGPEALARLRQRDRYRSGIEIEHRQRPQNVAVGADDGLLIDADRVATVVELSEAVLFDGAGKIRVGLGADEVVDGDGNDVAGGRLLAGPVRRRGCWPLRA